MVQTAKAMNFKELIVWQKGMDLAEEIYVLTQSFPREEKFGLISQMRRAAISVPSNISEGQARQSTAEFLQFLSHAKGSLAELETQLLLSVRLGYCSQDAAAAPQSHIEELHKMLAALRRSLLARG